MHPLVLLTEPLVLIVHGPSPRLKQDVVPGLNPVFSANNFAIHSHVVGILQCVSIITITNYAYLILYSYFAVPYFLTFAIKYASECH